MPFNTSQHTADHKPQAQGNDRRSGLFVAATSLARKGRYVDAIRLLRRALACGDCSQEDALDLQARIYVQQGLYLQAEFCWREAKRLDSSNPAYDAALERLRRAHLSTGRLFHLFATVAIILVTGLMLWQVCFVSPDIASRLRTYETSVAEIRGDVAKFQTAMKEDNEELAAGAAELRDSLSAFDRQLNEHLAEVRMSLEHEIGSLTTHRVEADATRAKRVDAIEATLAEVSKLVRSLEDRFVARVESGDIGLNNRVDQVQTRLLEMRAWIQESLVPLFQSLRPRDADALAAIIKNLREEKNRLAARVAHEKASFVPFMLIIFRDKLRKCEEELRMCEAEYEARVAPWERGMRMLRQNNVRDGEQAEK